MTRDRWGSCHVGAKTSVGFYNEFWSRILPQNCNALQHCSRVQSFSCFILNPTAAHWGDRSGSKTCNWKHVMQVSVSSNNHISWSCVEIKNKNGLDLIIRHFSLGNCLIDGNILTTSVDCPNWLWPDWCKLIAKCGTFPANVGCHSIDYQKFCKSQICRAIAVKIPIQYWLDEDEIAEKLISAWFDCCSKTFRLCVACPAWPNSLSQNINHLQIRWGLKHLFRLQVTRRCFDRIVRSGINFDLLTTMMTIYNRHDLLWNSCGSIS